MEFAKIKELNERIIKRATDEIEKDMITKNTCDMVDMKILSMAIDNVKDIVKLEEGSLVEEDQTMRYSEVSKTYEPLTVEETDFTCYVNKVMDKHGSEIGHKAIMAILNELMEDLKILNNRMYSNVMMKLKNML